MHFTTKVININAPAKSRQKFKRNEEQGMKKKTCFAALTIAVTMIIAACGKTESNSKVEETISVEAEENVQSAQTVENSVESNTKNEIEDSIIDLKGSRTVLSDTGVQPPERNFLPEGVAPEFMYFSYEDKNVGPYKAQEYLENIEFSVENEKLVVLWKQERRSAQIAVDIYDFTTTPVTKISHFFLATPSSLESTISDFGETNIAFSDTEANYFYSIPLEMDDYYSYEYCLNLFDCDYLSIIW